MPRPLILAIALLVAACFTGPHAESFRPATSPQGVELSLRLRRASVRGELLEVRDTALLVMQRTQITLVPLRAVRAVWARGYALPYRDGPATPAALARLRAVSRYPTGLSDEALRQLLAHAGQSEVLVVGSP